MTIGSVTLSARQWRESHVARSVAGFFLCCVGAGLFCLLFRDTATVASMPIVFLIAITLVAMNFGRLSAALGTCAAAFLFAMYLFEPIGELKVEDAHQRSSIGWLLLFGIAISF